MDWKYFIGFDLGGSRGRRILGRVRGDKLRVEEVRGLGKEMVEVKGDF